MLTRLKSLSLVVAAGILAPRAVLAQFAPFDAGGLTTISSPVDPGIKISYKDPKGACKTAFDTQQQYTGWVSLPGEFPTNIFFWFVAGREPTSALTLWLQGGPGSSSMFGFFTETGPCEVIEQGPNRLETAAREWGWDRASNMLFIDQPNQVGFSYDTPTNGTLDLADGHIVQPPLLNRDAGWTRLNGTFSSLEGDNTANTTSTAALAVWHMLQGFLGVFPEYNPPNTSSIGVNLFAESYGGKYGPVFFETWEEQNAKRQNGSLANSTLDIHLSALGIVNGCVDDAVQGPYYTSMMVNNTYGLQLLTSVEAGLANGSFYKQDGCRDLIASCRNATASFDPDDAGNVQSVNSICNRASRVCNELLDPFYTTGRSFYDIAHNRLDSFPSSLYLEYLNTRRVQAAIGSPVNFTDNNNPVQAEFMSTGDYQRGPIVSKLASLLASGVRIGLIYGDRDFICNWLGGESISLSVAATAGGAYAAGFPAAGYAPVIVNDRYIGGAVRQFGNLSFARIFQAGHFVPASQPETAFQVFARIILGTSVSTGARVDLGSYGTVGDVSAENARLDLPEAPSPTCYLRAMPTTCPRAAWEAIEKGEGAVINGVWYAASSDWPGATVTSTPGNDGGGVGGGGGGGGGGDGGGDAGAAPSSTLPLTGLFTATSTPDSKNAATSLTEMRSTNRVMVFSWCLVGLITVIL